MVNRRRVWTAIVVAASTVPWMAAGQTTAPSAAPTTQRAPQVEQAPPEFIRVTAQRYSAFCLPVDEAWVKQGLSQAKAADLPSTRPADIAAKVATNRDALVKGLSHDLDVDPAKVNAMLDGQLLPTLKKLETLQPPVVFLVATEQKIKTLLANGWSNPRIGYNRLMDQLKWDERLMLSLDQPMDEALFHCTYEPIDPPAVRIKKLRDAAEKFESDVAYSTAGRARVVVQVTLAQFMEKDVFAPLKLRDDQSWLQLGSVTWMAAKYSPMLTGTDPQQTLSDMIFENENAPVKAIGINLLELPSLKDLNPVYVRPYIEAARRKSTMVIQSLVSQKPEAIRDILMSVKKDPPKDGTELVTRVAATTGVDVTKLLKP
jgi:hypothetical protein